MFKQALHLSNTFAQCGKVKSIAHRSFRERGLTIPDYYNFLTGLVVVLFIATLVIIFVYEYESMRRGGKEQTQ